MSTLVPDAYTIAEHRITTSDGNHELYVQEWGNPTGTPIVYLHGGPGSGCEQKHKQVFDASKHRVVFIDQRGSGLSTPELSTEANTTQLLIQDIEQVRAQLNIDSWVVIGRSWGSTLALCYAIEHQSHVQRLVIGGIFLGTKAEDEWLLNGELASFFPEVWDKHGATPESVLRFAHLALPSIRLDDRFTEINEDEFDESFFKIERYYADNNWFLPDGYILQNAAGVTIPVTIIQGRYDMMTPPKIAYSLHKQLPNSTLQWTIAGHTQSDRGNFDAIKATLNQL